MSATSTMVYLNWSTSDGALHGSDTNQEWIDEDLAFGVTQPGAVTKSWAVNLQSSAFLQGTPYVLANIQFHLTGDPDVIQMLAATWPPLSGGLEMSFDGGQSWIRFEDPEQRITLPATSVLDQSGQLQPAETAQFLIRIVVPAGITPAGLSRVRLDVEFDIL